MCVCRPVVFSWIAISERSDSSSPVTANLLALPKGGVQVCVGVCPVTANLLALMMMMMMMMMVMMMMPREVCKCV